MAESDADQVIAHLRRQALLDDAAFARYWLEQRQTFRPRGARLLQAELRQLGVSSPLAQAAAAQAEPNAAEDAYRAASRRAFQLRQLAQPQFAQRLGQFLARRGFDWDTISAVVDQLWAEVSTSSDSARAPTV